MSKIHVSVCAMVQGKTKRDSLLARKCHKSLPFCDKHIFKDQDVGLRSVPRLVSSRFGLPGLFSSHLWLVAKGSSAEIYALLKRVHQTLDRPVTTDDPEEGQVIFQVTLLSVLPSFVRQWQIFGPFFYLQGEGIKHIRF